MFGLEGSGFIIAVAVTLLLSGAIVYYCNTRLTSMEKAIIKQNQVLADFIGNVKLQLTNNHPQESDMTSRNGGAGQVANGATQEAIDAAMDYYSNTTPENRIEVSEDSLTEGDSDEDDDSELSSSDEEDEDEDEDEDDDIVVLTEETTSDSPIEVIGLMSENPTVDTPEITELSINEITTTGAGAGTGTVMNEICFESITSANVEPEIKTIKLGDLKTEEQLEIATQASSTLSSIETSSASQVVSESVAETNEDDGSTVNSQAFATVTLEAVKAMKVKQLRQIAVQMELGSESSVKKIKKATLAEMIKSKIKGTE